MLNILVLCTANSARSILAEALFNVLGRGKVKAWSAGSAPTGKPNPLALETLQNHGHDVSGLRSKSWTEFAGACAPHMDAVITVCDSAASEACPVWPGAPVRAHWGLPDPAGVEPECAARAAFEETYARLKSAIEAVVVCEGLDQPERFKSALEAARPT